MVVTTAVAITLLLVVRPDESCFPRTVRPSPSRAPTASRLHDTGSVDVDDSRLVSQRTSSFSDPDLLRSSFQVQSWISNLDLFPLHPLARALPASKKAAAQCAIAAGQSVGKAAATRRRAEGVRLGRLSGSRRRCTLGARRLHVAAAPRTALVHPPATAVTGAFITRALQVSRTYRACVPAYTALLAKTLARALAHCTHAPSRPACLPDAGPSITRAPSLLACALCDTPALLCCLSLLPPPTALRILPRGMVVQEDAG